MSLKQNIAVYSALAVFSAAGWVQQIESVQAGGFSIREQSAEGQGASFAGIAAGGGKDISAMFFNPATITEHSGRKFEINAAAILPNSKLSNGVGTDLTNTPIIAGNGGNAGSLAGVPSTYSSLQVSEKLFLGLGINSPFGLATEYDSGWIGRYHGIKSEVLTLNANPVVAYKVSPMISVAVGAQIEYMDVQLTNAVYLAPGVDSVADVRADGFGYGFTMGATFKPTPNTRIGIGFRSAMKHKIKGKVKFSPGLGPLLSSGASGKMTLPETVTIGLRQKISPTFTVLAGFEWANWSRFKELRIKVASPAVPDGVTRQDWKDSFYYSLGGEYNYSDRTVLRAGVAYEKSPVPNETRTPRVADNDRVWVSAGFTHQLNSWISVTGAYSHIFVKKASLNQLASDPNNVRRGAVSGTYKAHVDILNMSVNATF